jgi:hypothetical protein
VPTPLGRFLHQPAEIGERVRVPAVGEVTQRAAEILAPGNLDQAVADRSEVLVGGEEDRMVVAALDVMDRAAGDEVARETGHPGRCDGWEWRGS